MLYFCRAPVVFTYFGLSLGTSDLNGNPYLNCFFSAAIDIIACIAIWLLVDHVPRPALLFCTLTFSGVMFLVIHLIPEGLHSHLLNMMTRGVSLWNCILVCLVWTFVFLRPAGPVEGVHLGGKVRCCLCLRLNQCVFHWAVSHCGQGHGLRGQRYSLTHWNHYLSLHYLH